MLQLWRCLSRKGTHRRDRRTKGGARALRRTPCRRREHLSKYDFNSKGTSNIEKSPDVGSPLFQKLYFFLSQRGADAGAARTANWWAG